MVDYIVHWLQDYANGAGVKGFIVGISGGIDSALTSTLCALTELDVLLVSMPIRQTKAEYSRAMEHIKDLEAKFDNVRSIDIELTDSFAAIEKALPKHVLENFLAMANTRARLRMTTLYALGQADGLLVAGTGNKVEDFGVGFFTKYGDGGVDLSPIADLVKTEVFDIARELGVVDSILEAKPTDGLWEDGRSDEEQIGASYPELEWAMGYEGDGSELDERHKEVLEIYNKFHRANLHKMKPIPVCEIPTDIKGSSL